MEIVIRFALLYFLLFTSRRSALNLLRICKCVLFIKSLFVPARLFSQDGTKFNLSDYIFLHLASLTPCSSSLDRACVYIYI